MRLVPLWLSLAACDRESATTELPADGPRPNAELVDMSAWVEGDSAQMPDPLADHRPEGVEPGCPLGSVLLEGAAIEIKTGICAYAWLQQPLAADLRPGDPVEIVYWHSALLSDPPAEGHFALLVGEQILFERTIAIPSDPAAYTESFEAPFGAEAGEIAALHLHNHGANDWNFLRVERVTEE